MKRITLLTALVALLSVAIFAQVTPPTTAQVETWYTAGGQFMAYGRFGFEDQTASMPTVNVAFDGDNVYIQGLAHYYPEGWIKGTINGNTAVFDNGQLAGNDGFGTYYILGSNDGATTSENIVFNYDAVQGVLEATTAYIIESSESSASEGGISAYAFWYQPKFTKEQPKGPEQVVAPEGLQTEEWAVSATDNYGAAVSTYFYIGFDGNDVYLKGFTHYLPDAWIKGELSEDGKSITFAGDQYFGPYDADYYTHYEFYLMKDGFTLTYDAETGQMTGVGELYVSEAIRQYKGDVYNDPVITKVVENVGTPAMPSISEIYDATSGPVVMFTVPTVDVSGNGMVSSKVFFQFLKDIEEEISPVTFEPSDYYTLNETMTEFPYGFTDNVYLFYNYMYLNQKDFSRWNKIGLQVIYTGGGEVNKSDIFWLDIKPYEKATFDFNAMTGEPCSSSMSHDGDITEDRTFTAGNVTLTVSPKEESNTTENRFWSTNNGPQLRVYSGTLTFEAAVGKVIKKMVFNNGKWNDGNSADTGSFDGNVWTGNAKKVVVTIAGNTQLNSIEVYPTDLVPTTVEVPENLVTETYTFKAKAKKPYYDPADLELWLNVGFDGDDAYIQGLAADVNDNADELWVKATKNAAGQYVIPANQFMGSVSFWMSSNDYYFTALDEAGQMIDIVLDFDADKMQFTTNQSLIINGLLTEVYAYETFNDVVITKFNEVAATPATPTINSIDFGEWSHGINCTIPAVGSNGETLIPKKLFYTVWIEKEGQQSPYTFTADMYYAFDVDATEVPWTTNYSTWDGSHSIYFYDDASVFDAWEKVGIQSIYYGGGECNKSSIAWIENPTCATGISNINADQNAAKVVYFNLAGQRMEAPKKGLNIVNGRKVMVK